MANSDTESNEALTVELHKDDEMDGQEDVELANKDSREDEPKKPKGGGSSRNREKMAKVMQQTINELEIALKESNDLLIERDEEIEKLKEIIDYHKQQITKEIATKTKLSQTLDDSHQKALEMEDSLKKWQLSLKEYQQRVSHLEAALQQERSHSVEQEKQFSELYSKQRKEVEQLTSQLIEIRQRGLNTKGASIEGKIPNVDESQLIFLKQAVYHLLTDSHAEEHLRAIVSILNFSPQERKAVYAKVQEKKGRASYGTGRSATPIVLTQ